MTNLSGNISSACAREIPIISVHGWFSTVRMKGSHRTGRLKHKDARGSAAKWTSVLVDGHCQGQGISRIL